MACINELFPVIIYFLIIILLIALIILIVKLHTTLLKVDRVIDDVEQKSSKLNGIFDIVDSTTDAISSISDVAIGLISGKITNILNKRKRKEEDIDE